MVTASWWRAISAGRWRSAWLRSWRHADTSRFTGLHRILDRNPVGSACVGKAVRNADGVNHDLPVVFHCRAGLAGNNEFADRRPTAAGEAGSHTQTAGVGPGGQDRL